MKNKIFKSFDEYKKHYFPNEYHYNWLNNAKPEEIGKWLAKKTVERLKTIIDKNIKLYN